MAKRSAAVDHVHRMLMVDQEIIPTTGLSPLDIDQIRRAEREGRVRCPTCGGKMTLLADPEGPVAMHRAPNPYADHEPEDQSLKRATKLIEMRLRELFPSGVIDTNVHFPEIEHLSDLLMLTPTGARVAVEVQHADLTSNQLQRLRAQYASQNVLDLWIMDIRRLKTTKATKKQPMGKTSLERLETALLSQGIPLLYLDTIRREIAWVRPHPQARELAHLGDQRIGQVPSLVRRYPLSQLRIKEGSWRLPTEYDAPPPQPPELPANLLKRLERLRAKAAA